MSLFLVLYENILSIRKEINSILLHSWCIQDTGNLEHIPLKKIIHNKAVTYQAHLHYIMC